MDYKFTDIILDDDFCPRESDLIHPCILKNCRNDVLKALEFLNSDEKFLYIHGFIGTGKRQFVNYICEYLEKDVLVLEYFCRESTVDDDILLSFIDKIENSSTTKTLSLNAKISTLNTKFQKIISSIKKPTLIIFHSFDNVSEENEALVSETFSKLLKEPNVKIIITTCALKTNLLNGAEEDKSVFLKAFTKDIFKEFVQLNKINASDRQIEDLYELTRGYYFYTALSVKIIQSMEISISEFLQKMKNADSTFDKYLGELYISLIPSAIRNFFWFLRAIRHGISLNALAIFEIYDEFSIQYLKTNCIAFQSGEYLYLHDFFAKRVDVILPMQTEIKLHKYIIGIYERQLKEPLINRAIFISRQALRSEIDYHRQRITDIESGKTDKISPEGKSDEQTLDNSTVEGDKRPLSVADLINEAKKLATKDKITDAIVKFKDILDNNEINSITLTEIRHALAELYEKISDYVSALHYYELVEAYYKNNKELINLNYLYYEMTNLYYKMYKHKRAVETIKKVIYSVDTPQSLMVKSCTLLGNIYSDMNNLEEAFNYYKKAIDSLDENVQNETLAELYFKFALANDDKGDLNLAFEYYNRCLSVPGDNKYLALAYSNLASCYYESGNSDEALNCFMKAYEIEKQHNNYDGIYYTASHIAKILVEQKNDEAVTYLKEAKQSADFLNEAFYMAEASISAGDYYYNIPEKAADALREYCKAKQTALNSGEDIDIASIDKRIEDMKLRMPKSTFSEIIKKYE